MNWWEKIDKKKETSDVSKNQKEKKKPQRFFEQTFRHAVHRHQSDSTHKPSNNTRWLPEERERGTWMYTNDGRPQWLIASHYRLTNQIAYIIGKDRWMKGRAEVNSGESGEIFLSRNAGVRSPSYCAYLCATSRCLWRKAPIRNPPMRRNVMREFWNTTWKVIFDPLPHFYS